MPKKMAYLTILFIVLKIIISVKNSSVQPVWGLIFNETIPMAEAVTINKMYKTVAPKTETVTIIKNNIDTEQQPDEEIQVHKPQQAEQLIETYGLNQITFQPETDSSNEDVLTKKERITLADIEKLKDINYLKKNFYTVTNLTDITEDDINPEEFIKYDFSINTETPGPKVLIIHTHSSEMYKDSDPNKPEDGVIGVGNKLAEILETKYNIETLHHKGQYDIVDGKYARDGAYERMEIEVKKILNKNPSIEVLLDIHRDGVNEDTHLVTTINGKQYAQLMYFNGISKLKKGNQTVPINGLDNPYVKDNLALSFNMQLLSNKLYEHFTRRVYINAYRYSLHMLPKSMLIEVGAQTNTKQEALNSMELLAGILAQVLGNVESNDIM